MNWKKWSLVLTLAFALSVFLVACGGNNSEDEGNNTAANNDNATNASDGDAEQVININIKTEPPSLHPGKASDTTSSAVLDQVFEGLTRINQDTHEPEEAMAESIEMSDDGLTYTFKIREAEWTNGDPVTADDFEYAWKSVLDPENPDKDYSYQLYPIKGAEEFDTADPEKDDVEALRDAVGVTAEDEDTLVVELEEPTDYFLEVAAFHTLYPINKNSVEENEDWYLEASEDYVTNGPFKMTSWEHKDQIVLEKNEDYWDADTVKLETINMYMVDQESTELSMYENGDLDWAGSPTGSIPLAAIPTMKEEGELEISPRAGVYYYAFNHDEEPFDNENIRKAFSLAIDRQAMVDNITQGEQMPAMALVPPTMFEENEEGYFKDNDVDGAKEHLEKGLEELGLDELPTVNLSYNTDEGHAAMAQAVQDMWKKNLDVDVELNNEEWNVYLDSMSDGDFQIGRMGWIADFNDPINFLEIFETVGGNNYTNWEDSEYQNLLDKSRKELDPDKRLEILKEAEELFMDDMVIAPVYFYTNVYAHKDYVQDVKVGPLGVIQFKWGSIADH